MNILRNQKEDEVRGVNFMPDNWGFDDMYNYAKENLNKADQYMKSIRNKNIQLFCKIPLRLAHATLQALSKGKEKMSRDEVMTVVNEVKMGVYQ